MSGEGGILAVSPNWLGDVVMALPAVQAAEARARADGRSFAVLTRPAFAPVWRMALAEGSGIVAAGKNDPVMPLARKLREGGFAEAYVVPHSFRAARAPFLARIPRRIGLPGHFLRDWMMTEIRRPKGNGGGREAAGHQAWEILDLFGVEPAGGRIPAPRLEVPGEVLEAVRGRIGEAARPWIAFVPGAARGPSKQWPTDHWQALLRKVEGRTAGTVLLLGTPGEAELCGRVAGAAADGGRVRDLSGKTTLEEMAAALALADAACCNDSGGMHLAAALGTALVAFFGITDPDKTGPLGAGKIRILQHSERRTRDIPRDCPEAVAALRAISPEEAWEALAGVLG